MIDSELISAFEFFNSTTFILCFVAFLIVFYLLISLLTWSMIKPLKYMGIPTLIVGIICIPIYLAPNVIINFLPLDEYVNIIEKVLPLFMKPLLIYGIACFIVGLLMIIVYKIINKKRKSNIETNNIVENETLTEI